MIISLYSKQLLKCDVVLKSSVVLLTPVSGVDKAGSVNRKCEFQPFDIAGSLAPFKSSDFSIVNLEQIGALSKLKTTYMSNMHDMNIADRFDNYQIDVQDVKNVENS